MITKGAVVIVKYGDPEFADAIAEGLEQKKSGPSKCDAEYVAKLERENFFLKRIVEREIGKSLAELEIEYGYEPKTPKLIQYISNTWAFMVYALSSLVEKGSIAKE